MMLSIVYITMNRSSELIRSIESCERCVTIEHDYVVVDNELIEIKPEIISLSKNLARLLNQNI